ncbi:MAG: hypothetical protein HY072_04215 [Deltaproteobacteria bacterium]|nr:hypothetical protein [Deltaproteobacteria bacterium]
MMTNQKWVFLTTDPRVVENAELNEAACGLIGELGKHHSLNPRTWETLAHWAYISLERPEPGKYYMSGAYSAFIYLTRAESDRAEQQKRSPLIATLSARSLDPSSKTWREITAEMGCMWESGPTCIERQNLRHLAQLPAMQLAWEQNTSLQGVLLNEERKKIGVPSFELHLMTSEIQDPTKYEDFSTVKKRLKTISKRLGSNTELKIVLLSEEEAQEKLGKVEAKVVLEPANKESSGLPVIIVYFRMRLKSKDHPLIYKEAAREEIKHVLQIINFRDSALLKLLTRMSQRDSLSPEDQVKLAEDISAYQKMLETHLDEAEKKKKTFATGTASVDPSPEAYNLSDRIDHLRTLLSQAEESSPLDAAEALRQAMSPEEARKAAQRLAGTLDPCRSGPPRVGESMGASPEVAHGTEAASEKFQIRERLGRRLDTLSERFRTGEISTTEAGELRKELDALEREAHELRRESIKRGRK